MATPAKRTELDECASACRQCYATCQRVVAHATPGATLQLHMLLLSCADACRVCADMLQRCVDLGGQTAIGTMALTMSGTCGQLCTTTAEACWQADHGTMREPVEQLTDCAQRCRALDAQIMQSAVPEQANPSDPPAGS